MPRLNHPIINIKEKKSSASSAKTVAKLSSTSSWRPEPSQTPSIQHSQNQGPRLNQDELKKKVSTAYLFRRRHPLTQWLTFQLSSTSTKVFFLFSRTIIRSTLSPAYYSLEGHLLSLPTSRRQIHPVTLFKITPARSQWMIALIEKIAKAFRWWETVFPVSYHFRDIILIALVCISLEYERKSANRTLSRSKSKPSPLRTIDSSH